MLQMGNAKKRSCFDHLFFLYLSQELLDLLLTMHLLFQGLISYEFFLQLYTWKGVELHPCGLLNCGNRYYRML